MSSPYATLVNSIKLLQTTTAKLLTAVGLSLISSLHLSFQCVQLQLYNETTKTVEIYSGPGSVYVGKDVNGNDIVIVELLTNVEFAVEKLAEVFEEVKDVGEKLIEAIGCDKASGQPASTIDVNTIIENMPNYQVSVYEIEDGSSKMIVSNATILAIAKKNGMIALTLKRNVTSESGASDEGTSDNDETSESTTSTALNVRA